MKILLVNNSADIYGASRSLLRLACKLREKGHEPVVLLPEDGPLAGRLRAADIRIETFPALRVITRPVLSSWRIIPWLVGLFPSALRLANLIKREHFDIVHTNTGVIVSSGLAAKIARRPHVWHVRDWFQEFGPLWNPYSRYILWSANRILCVSRPIASQFPASDKIEALNNGFDLAEFPALTDSERAAARRKWNIGPDDFVVGTVGRIKFKRKGQEFLLRAAAVLRDRGMKIICLLAGGAAPGAEDQVEKMQQLADELRVPAIFTGELPDARAAYAAMDVFVLSSAQPEPFGGVVMEAMALELPVVGTAIGGTIEQIAEGETGLLVPPADPHALAMAIKRFADPATRERMGTAGRERIAACFNLDSMASRILVIYESLVACSRHGNNEKS